MEELTRSIDMPNFAIVGPRMAYGTLLQYVFTNTTQLAVIVCLSVCVCVCVCVCHTPVLYQNG